jgi:hypothetical protein
MFSFSPYLNWYAFPDKYRFQTLSILNNPYVQLIVAEKKQRCKIRKEDSMSGDTFSGGKEDSCAEILIM